jgi:hypothetical protein
MFCLRTQRKLATNARIENRGPFYLGTTGLIHRYLQIVVSSNEKLFSKRIMLVDQNGSYLIYWGSVLCLESVGKIFFLVPEFELRPSYLVGLVGRHFIT